VARIEAANQRHAARRAPIGCRMPSVLTPPASPPRHSRRRSARTRREDAANGRLRIKDHRNYQVSAAGCTPGSLAQCINNPLGYRSVYTAGTTISKKRAGQDCGVIEGKPARTKAHRARETIDEVRRILPAALAEFETSVAQSFTVHSSSSDHAKYLRAVQGLPQAKERCEIFKQVLALLNSLPPRPKQRARAWWRLDAAKLWHIYRATIDVSAGISPNGPAVRFIRAALARMGYRRLPKHIESALRDPVNWGDEYLRRRFDEVMI